MHLQILKAESPKHRRPARLGAPAVGFNGIISHLQIKPHINAERTHSTGQDVLHSKQGTNRPPGAPGAVREGQSRPIYPSLGASWVTVSSKGILSLSKV